MARIIFIDIPVVDEILENVVTLRFKAQDLINLKMHVTKPYQKFRKQFSRGLLELSSFLKTRGGHDVLYYPYDSIKTDRFKEDLADSDFVGISGNNSAYYGIVEDIAAEVKHVCKEISIVVGGYHVSSTDTEILSTCSAIDYVIRGEAEYPLLRLLDGADLTMIESLSYRIGDTIVQNGLCIPLKPEEIPTPDYTLLHGSMNDYNYNIQTVRGCIYRCAFCANGFFWNTPRVAPIEHIIEELSLLNSKLHSGTIIHFSDNIMSLDLQRTFALLEGIQRRKLDLQFSCDIKANHVTKELVEMMKRSNFVKVSLGFEDADDTVLKQINKGISFEDNINASKIIKKYSDIMVEAYWIIGLPGSTHASMKLNLDKIKFLLRNNVVDVISSSLVYTPLPGTPVFNIPANYGVNILTKDWSKYLRNYFEPIYELESLGQNELKEYFLLFEKTILEEYCSILGLNIDELADSPKLG